MPNSLNLVYISKARRCSCMNHANKLYTDCRLQANGFSNEWCSEIHATSFSDDLKRVSQDSEEAGHHLHCVPEGDSCRTYWVHGSGAAAPQAWFFTLQSEIKNKKKKTYLCKDKILLVMVLDCIYIHILVRKILAERKNRKTLTERKNEKHVVHEWHESHVFL